MAARKVAAKKSPQVIVPALAKAFRRQVFDTETTGLLKPDVADLAAQPKIIEYALVEINRDYEEVARHTWLINPGEPLTPDINKITGLFDKDLADKPSFIQVLPEIEEAMMGVHQVIAHNLAFDWGMLTNELKRVGRQYAFPYPPNQLCTVQQASELLFGRRAKMTELYERAMGKPLAQTHRALDDVLALVEIVRALRW